jgi:hypothetical protein
MKTLRLPFIPCAAAVALAVGCSPVTAETMIAKRYATPPQSDAPFRVYLDKAQIPDNAEPLGVVALRDRGNVKCDSTRVFSLARDEAVKAGGNALYVY